jgi:hypothetical protein
VRSWILTLALLIAAVRVQAAPVCFDAFEADRTSKVILEQRGSLDYEDTVKIIEESLSREEIVQWRSLVKENGEKIEKKIKEKFEIVNPHTEQDIFERAESVIRSHVQAGFKRNKMTPILSIYIRGPIRNPELQQALTEHFTYLAAIARDLPEAKLATSGTKAYLFGRLMLSSLIDTQMRTYRALSKNDELLRIAERTTPDELRRAIGKKIRLETGVRWSLQHFVNFKLAVFTAAGLTVAIEHHAGQTKLNDLMKSDPRGKIMENVTPEVAVMLGRTPTENAHQLLEDLVKSPPAEATEAEIDFLKAVGKEIGSKPE